MFASIYFFILVISIIVFFIIKDTLFA